MNNEKQERFDDENDTIGKIIQDTFEKMKPHVEMPESLRKKIKQKSHDIRIADKYTNKVHEQQVMQASVTDSKTATEFARIADSVERDMIITSPPGCVMLQGESKPMQETIAKFGVLRQDVNLDDGRAVATYLPPPTQTANGLAQQMTRFYQQRAAIEYCQRHGVDSIDTSGKVIVAKGGPRSMDTLNNEFDNVIRINRVGDRFSAQVKLNSEVTSALGEQYELRSSPGVNLDIAEFRFDSMREAEQFAKDAERLTAEYEAKMLNKISVHPQPGITIMKAHELSMSGATNATIGFGQGHNNTVLLHSVDGTPSNMNIMVAAHSALGQKMMEQYQDALVHSSNPGVATFHFDSQNAAMAFLNDANRVGYQLNQEEREGCNTVADNDIGDTIE
jgi:hypothetical protein